MCCYWGLRGAAASSSRPSWLRAACPFGWPAVRDLLDRDEQARAHRVALVTGAGFGPAATQTLVLRLVARIGMAPARVRVAAAAGVTRHSDGVRQTVRESLSHGVAITYRDGQV